MIFERLSLSLIFVLACLVLLEVPAVKGAMARASDAAATLKPLCAYADHVAS